MHNATVLVLLALFSCVFSQCTERIRKPWHMLTPAEQRTFLDALQMAKDDGLFETLANIHESHFERTHRSSAFPAWHRWFLWVFENRLRSYRREFACLTIPYWPWEQTSALGISYLFNAEDFGSPTGGSSPPDSQFSSWRFTRNGRSIGIARTFPSGISLCGEACVEAAIIGNPRYGAENGFRYIFEMTPHGSTHSWVGGNMGTSTSAYDPLFWLHHSNVDRLFSIWQDCWDHDLVAQDKLGNSQYTQSPSDGYQLDDCMDFGNVDIFPGCITPRMMHSIQGNSMVSMEYYYQELNMIPLINSNFGQCKFNWTWYGSQSSPRKRSIESGDYADYDHEEESDSEESDYEENDHEGNYRDENDYENDHDEDYREEDDRERDHEGNYHDENDYENDHDEEEDYPEENDHENYRENNREDHDNFNIDDHFKDFDKHFDFTRSSDRHPRAEHPRNYPRNGHTEAGSHYPTDRRDVRNSRGSPRHDFGREIDEFFNEAFGNQKPPGASRKHSTPGKFCNADVQKACNKIDNYVGTNETLSSKMYRIHLYSIAECIVEGVHSYISDEFLQSLGMEDLRDHFVPVCHKEKLPEGLDIETQKPE